MTKTAPAPKPADRIVVQNRKARHEYHVLDTWETGVVLQGTEVKSLREGKANMQDSFARVMNGEVWLFNLHISPYEQGNRFNHEPTRTRKLLLHKREISSLIGKVKERGLTLVPTRLYFKDGRAKVELALARGRKAHDKRQVLAERDAQKEMRNAMGRAIKRGRR